ncbi:MAG TPA: AAA-like domain-containing protein [Tepidisphaeraceae bacterium]|jgi:WD40 repeat protein|nr:AAA-like domain-containing protein [Tepidisphaeraceae bacterium]
MSANATAVSSNPSASGEAAGPKFYTTGGTMEATAASYVERRADHELYDAVINGHFCYVLTSRQMGKSSLVARTAAKLQQPTNLNVARAAQLDLTRWGQEPTAEQWYEGLMMDLGESLHLQKEFAEFWELRRSASPLNRFIQLITDVALRELEGTLVIFLDEIDFTRSLKNVNTDEFFSAIRECYSRRAKDPRMQRLTFCLLGVATPTDLIRNTRTTPFNIGRRIQLSDFTPGEAAPLARGLRDDPALARRLLDRVLYWTGGHPYLTQQFCKAVSDRRDIADTGGIDRLCQEMFLARQAHSSDNNLIFVRSRILHVGGTQGDDDLVGLLELYRKILARQKVPDAENNPLIAELHLSGITRSVDGFLSVRNRIYERVFDKKWIKSSLPGQESQRQRSAYIRGLLRAGGIAAVVLAAVTTLAVIAFQQSRLATARQIKADEEKAKAVHASAIAETRSKEAVAARTHANLRLADARVAQGDALMLTGKWEEARRAYEDAAAVLTLEKESALTADLGLLEVDAHSPPPLLQLRAGIKPSAPGNPWLGYGISLAANGRTIVCGDSGSITRVSLPEWTSEQLKLPVPYASAISFSQDGKQAVLVAKPNVLVWDIAAGKVISRWPLPAGGSDLDCYEIVCQPDGKNVLLNRLPGKDGFLCDARTGQVKEMFGSQAFGVNASGREKALQISKQIKSFRFGRAIDGVVAVSDDGQTAAIGWHPLELFSMSTGTRLATLQGHNTGIETALFSADRQSLVTASQDRTIRLWETESGGERLCLCPESHIEALNATPDLHLVCSGERNGSIKLWATQSAGDLPALDVTGVRHMVFSPDGLTFLTENADALNVWDVATGELIQVLRRPQILPAAPSTQMAATNPSAEVSAPIAVRTEGICLSKDATYALAAASDGSVYVWNVASGDVIYKRAPKAGEHVRAEFLPDNNQLLLTTYRPYTKDAVAQCTIINLLSPSAARTFATAPSMIRPCLTPDGRTLCIVRFDQLILYEIATGKKVATTPIQLPESISPDNRIMVSGIDKTALIVQDETMSLYDLRTGESFATDPSHESAIACGMLSPDGRLIARGTYDGAITIWDGRLQHPMKPIREYPPSDFQAAVALSPDGRMLATTTNRGAVVMRDLSRPAAYRKFNADADATPGTIDSNRADAVALANLGRWFAFRGMDEWAAELLSRARSHGAGVESLMLGRCYWKIHAFSDARREFQNALDQHQAPPAYLRLCLAALARSQNSEHARQQK